MKINFTFILDKTITKYVYNKNIFSISNKKIEEFQRVNFQYNYKDKTKLHLIKIIINEFEKQILYFFF